MQISRESRKIRYKVQAPSTTHGKFFEKTCVHTRCEVLLKIEKNDKNVDFLFFYS